tara:strand:- start:921 stop:1496 length:576 start_codon:yes stop_codon:yes gene_type:complete
MLKEICATLLLLCASTIQNFDFDYSNDPKREFVEGITECTVLTNSSLPPQFRVVVVISVAQAILESNWGESRFAVEGNNFYGIIQTDETEPHLKAENSEIMVKVYGRKCESVGDYISLLNTSTHFTFYRAVRMKQFISREVNLDDVINTLGPYAMDPAYTKKIKEVAIGLLTTYPELFKIDEMMKKYNKGA